MTKVLMSYSVEDENLAQQLSSRLAPYQIDVVCDVFEADYGLNFDKIFDTLETGDSWVVFFSKYTRIPRSTTRQFSAKQLHNRNIAVIPVLVFGQYIPPELRGRVHFHLQRDPASELNKIARYLQNIPNINFDKLDAKTFEELVIALLKKLRFREIQGMTSDYGYDIQAKTAYRDPFGNRHDIHWLIEVKFYKESRGDIHALSKLSNYLGGLPPDYNGVLITNSQITSTAREWLQEAERSRRTQITVVDGVQLRELILKYEELVEQFFGARG